jgi:tubulin delta
MTLVIRYKLQGPKLYEEVWQSIDREVIKGEDFQGFVLLQSVAGGTGSGLGTLSLCVTCGRLSTHPLLGSYFTQKLRQEYPTCQIFNYAVVPYSSGEVVMQAYNVVLTLHLLYKVGITIAHLNIFKLNASF